MTTRVQAILTVVMVVCGGAHARSEPDPRLARAIDSVSAARLREFHDLLAAEPHVAGMPGDLRTVVRLEGLFGSFGLRVERHEIWPYLSRPVAAELQIVAPDRIDLPLNEEPVPGDALPAHPEQVMAHNAYSGSGDVTGEVVYAHYARQEDFATLAELGVEVRGRIVLARYGGNYRGFKAKFAEQAGAAGLVIFTDPADSGYMKGLPYPDGPWANDAHVQRGSIVTIGYSGDPLTPGVEATKDAGRLDPVNVPLPRIPVQPVGARAAREILSRMTGPGVPAGWQGGIGCAYRLTGGESLRVRLRVEQERRVTPTWNVLGTLVGAVHPDQMVIVGCHHDAWCCGASDPMAGMICLLETARILGELAAAGEPPARSIVFAAWGAEEHGIIGSSEWVEGRRDSLARDAVAYLNLDMAAMGPRFGSAASPSLRRVIADAARLVPQARDASGRSVYDEWIARGADPARSDLPLFGSLGGGSDHVGFYCHAGVPSAGLSGHGSDGTAYHSAYDTLAWYRKAVGEDYEPALMVARMTLATAWALANEPVVPYDPARYGAETLAHLAALSSRAGAAGLVGPIGADGIGAELAVLAGEARRFASRADAAMQDLERVLSSGGLNARRASGVHRAMMSFEQAWIDPAGIPERPWFRNLFASTDANTGYDSWVLPALRWAIEAGDRAAFADAEARYRAVFVRLNASLDELRRALE